MIKTINLNKTYFNNGNRTHALKNINISIDKGKIISILGPSGSGKSTLLNCLSGIDKPTSGDIFIDNINITKLNDNELTNFRAKKMGFVFQFFNLIPVLTALENVELPLLINGKNKKIAEEEAYRMLDLVLLKNKHNKSPSSLSGGEQQRVAIARSLIFNPEIVWADEPTGSIDTETSKEILELILKINKEKKVTFVIVTHDKRVSDYSETILRMDSGKII